MRRSADGDASGGGHIDEQHARPSDMAALVHDDAGGRSDGADRAQPAAERGGRGSGGGVLACDAADLQRNLDGRTPCGWTARPGDAEAAQASVDRLADLAAQAGTEVWSGHDPDRDYSPRSR